VSAESEDAPSRAADVPQEKLDDGCRSDVLDPNRVLGPAHRVADGRGSLTTGIPAQRLRHLQELLFGHAAHLLDQLRGVPAEVPFQDLIDAARMLEREILVRLRYVHGTIANGRHAHRHLAEAGGGLGHHALVLPAGRIVAPALGIPT
jgi:hypothetical protein